MAIFTRVNDLAHRGVDKIKMANALLCAAIMTTVVQVAPVFCLNAEGIDVDTIMGSVLGIIFTIAMWTGVVLTTWAIISLVSALKNDDAESKSRATQLLVVGVILMGLKGIMSTVLNNIGVTVTMPS